MDRIATPVARFLSGTRIVRGVLYKSVLLWTPVFWIALVQEPKAVSSASAWGFGVNMALYLMWAFAVNDYADRDCDAAVGKERTIARLSDRVILVILASLLLANFAMGYYLAGSGYYVLILALGLWSGLAYSLKPFRIKERGVWGICFPGILGKVIPFAMVCALYKTASWCLVVMCMGEYLKNTIDLLFHQIVDVDNDRAGGVKTFVVEQGEERATCLLRRLAWIGLLPAVSIAVLYGVYIPEFRWVLAGMLVLSLPVMRVSWKRFSARDGGSLTGLVPIQYLYGGYAVYILSPLWLSLIAAIRNPEFMSIALFLTVILGFQTVFYLRYRYR